MKLIDKEHFGGNREIVIKRDGERCVKCGMSRQEHIERFGRDITVDHIDGNGRNNPAQTKNNQLHNLQTLCLPCHGEKDIARRGWFSRAGLAQQEVYEIKRLAQEGVLGIDIARIYHVSADTVSQIKNGKSHKTLVE